MESPRNEMPLEPGLSGVIALVPIDACRLRSVPVQLFVGLTSEAQVLHLFPHPHTNISQEG